LATVLNLPAPRLEKHSPIPIPEKSFKRILGSFKNSIPDLELSRRVEEKVTIQSPEVTRQVTQLYSKISPSVLESYFVKTLDGVLRSHPRRDSFHVVIAATFLVVLQNKDGQTRKITSAEKKKLLDAFDGRFTNKEFTEWIKIIETELDESKWFERFPVSIVETPRKRKADGEGDVRKVKLAKNVSGIGIMVSLFRLELT
jgi:hypothetical protein